MKTTCCVVGGGPAGMMLGLLLARAGVDVVVLEKHADFLRDFRGDTIHPSTLELVHELGLMDDFLGRPHQQTKQLRGWIGNTELTIADFTRLPTKCKFLAFMPQWDFLDFLADEARRYPSFHLKMQTKVKDLIREGDRVVGVTAESPEGPLEIRADLVVGTDGRHSTVREKAGLSVMDLGAPIDVLWMRLSRKPTEPATPLGRFDTGRIMAMLYREEYWQCAFVIPKGGYDEIHRKGLDFLRSEVAALVPFLSDRVGELRSWDDVKLLTVKVDRLREWAAPGILCIGDAAHAMSPVGGVGINLAIQDAVAAANILQDALLKRSVTLEDLKRVQRRRMFPTRVTQRMQVIAQDRIIARVLQGKGKLSVPFFMKWGPFAKLFPHLTARVIGLGIRPEHIYNPAPSKS